VARATTVANLVSGAVGFCLSLLHNSGWWVVVWFPWVSRNEVGIPSQLNKFLAYYVAAFLLSILIEGVVEQIMLRSRYSGWKVWKASLLANFVSYLLASVLMYSYSFGG
jgi:branched-subunit amino acid transport protein